MSSRRPELKSWAAYGFMAYLLFGTFWSLGGLYVRAMGPCPAFSSNAECEWSAAYKLWLFPLSQIAFVAVGYVLLRLARKWAAK